MKSNFATYDPGASYCAQAIQQITETKENVFQRVYRFLYLISFMATLFKAIFKEGYWDSSNNKVLP